MEGPSTVRLQRKRNELPPDRLVVQRNTPAGANPTGKRKAEQLGPTTYVLQSSNKRPKSSDADAGEAENRQSRPASFHRKAPATTKGASEVLAQPAAVTNRIYHLRTPTSRSFTTQTGSPRKRKNDDVATVVEKRLRTDDPNQVRQEVSQHEVVEPEHGAAPNHEPEQPRPLKRPGRSAAIRRPAEAMDVDPPKPENPRESQRKKMEALAEEMHRFALDELAKTPKPQFKARPKLSAARAQTRHQERSAATSKPESTSTDVDMDSDGEYVYDTYVLATPAADKKDADEDAADVLRFRDVEGNVGYLVITEADEEAWENYMDEHEGNNSEDTDDDDENAEDYYGADYPSDELASDDEFDRGAYGYRAGAGSDDEQYDEDTGAWSDDEEPRAKGRMPGNFAKYLSERRGANEVNDD